MKRSFYMNTDSLPNINTSTSSNFNKTHRLNNSNSKFNLFNEELELISTLELNELPQTDRNHRLSQNIVIRNGEPFRETMQKELKYSANDVMKLIHSADSSSIENYPDNVKEKILKYERMRLEEEKTFETKRKTLESDLIELKNIHSKYIKAILNNQEDINLYQQDIDMLKIENNSLQEEHKNKTNNIATNFNASRVNNVRQQTMKTFERMKSQAENELMELRSKMQKTKLKNDQLISDKSRKIEIAKALNTSIKNQVTEVEAELKAIEEELKSIKKTLYNYYHDLLEKGSDMRSEGITWIIKSIWSLGTDVKLSKIPNFLDEMLVKYIFKRAKLEIYYEKLKRSCEEVRCQISDNSNASLEYSLIFKKKGVFRNKKHREGMLDDLKETEEDNKMIKDYTNFYHNMLINYKNMQEKKNSIQGKIKLKKSTRLEFKKTIFVQEYLKGNTQLDLETKNNYNTLSSLQMERDRVKKLILDMTEHELARLSKELLLKNYCRRFSCNQKQVLATILGIDKAHLENSKLIREYKVYLQKKEEASTYSIGKQ